MISRKEFLRHASAVIASAVAAPVVTMMQSCAPPAYILRAQTRENRVLVPLETLPDLLEEGSHVRVFITHFPNPIILFRQEDGEHRAVLSTCSHNGCEVRKLLRKFECPCHGSEYDLTGKVTRGPAPDPLETFAVERFADRLEIILEGPP